VSSFFFNVKHKRQITYHGCYPPTTDLKVWILNTSIYKFLSDVSQRCPSSFPYIYIYPPLAKQDEDDTGIQDANFLAAAPPTTSKPGHAAFFTQPYYI
jgi:hypothetical protein